MEPKYISGEFRLVGSSAEKMSARVRGNAENLVEIMLDGTGIRFGSGSATPDTNVYRGGANALKTDDSFQAVLGQVPAGGAFSATRKTFFIGGLVPDVLNGGTDQAPVAGTVYFGELFIPCNYTITGVTVFNGSAVGTDKLIVALYDRAGAVVANSALAGTTATGTNALQAIAFTATYAAKGPDIYYVSVSCDGTTYRSRQGIATGPRGGSAAGVFGTLDAITPPTAAAAFPYGFVY